MVSLRDDLKFIPEGGGEGPLSHGQGRDSSPRGGAKKSLNIPFSNH